MANVNNLIPFPKGRSSEEARNAGRKGGIASGIARKKRKKMQETLDLLLKTPVKDDNMKEHLDELGIEKESQDYQMALMVSILGRAIKGDEKSLSFITDMMQETPKKEEEQSESQSFVGPIIVDDIVFEEDTTAEDDN